MTTETSTQASSIPVMPPMCFRTQLQASQKSIKVVQSTRDQISNILTGKDNRLLIIAGPCSIHDPEAALDYATRLLRLSKEVEHKMLLVMRVYFEKPRTSVGWKGLVNDPYIDNSCDMAHGLRIARELLLEITSSGLGAGAEMLDPLISPYISDLISYTAIGARTSESQTHRQLASGLSMPVGFKNSTDGSLDSAVNAILSAKNSQSFLSMDDSGHVCIARTDGNHHGHIILRGGKSGPNYDSLTLNRAELLLQKNKLNTALVIDCSHMNAGKKYHNQINVWNESIINFLNGYRSIRGLMVESNIYEGNQQISKHLQYGVSITDECIGWETTEDLLLKTCLTLENHRVPIFGH